MNSFKIALVSLLAGGLFYLTPAVSAQGTVPAPSTLSRVAGRFIASNYAYGFGAIPAARVNTGNATTGSSTILLDFGSIALPDGRTVLPFQVGATILLGLGTGVQETITPTSVSGCTFATPSGIASCAVTASFTNLHFHGEFGASGTFGLQEAIDDAQNAGGGVATIDQYWASLGGTDATISGALVYANVTVEDATSPSVEFWNITPSTATFLAVPTTLTAVTALPSATPVGAYTTGTYHFCVSYVDLAGNEGPCSLDFSQAGLATGSFIFTAPAASTGAVGYTIYISLTGGTYALSYQVPLSSTICRLTTLESITPACAVTNALYAQTGATATVTAITTSTAPLALQLGVASTTADYVGNSNARTTYAYAAGGRVGATGTISSSLPFTAGPATVASTVPQVIGTLAVPAGFMNQVGKSIRICGKEQMTNASATIEDVQFWWDGAGSDAAGVPVKIGDLQVGGTGTAVAYNGEFCETFITTVSGAGVTAGSVLTGFGNFILSIASAPVGSFTPGNDVLTAAVASLNLAGGGGFTSRIHVVQLHTTGTDVSPKLVNLTLEELN